MSAEAPIVSHMNPLPPVFLAKLSPFTDRIVRLCPKKLETAAVTLV